MEFNKYQSALNRDEVTGEVYAEIMEYISSVAFIRNLISPSRRYVKDMPKDEQGRVIVDFSNPHILENMDYFRQPAIHYQTYKCYTKLHPNPHPSSSYFKFWKEEARRCREGLVREDGEWIPGAYYFYLNYSPMVKTVLHDKRSGKKAERTFGFPDVYDGDYLFFHYVERCRREGCHAGMLKKRGAGHSYKSASGLARLLILGDTEFNKEGVAAFAIASEKEYLIKDGILNKFKDILDWCAKATPFPRLLLKNSLDNMVWEMGYVDKNGFTHGSGNTVMGVTTHGDPDKARGKRGHIYWDEWGVFPNLLKSWQVARESVEEGDYAHSIMIGGGTGGTEGADFRGAEEMFYNPMGYNILGVPNVYDRNVNGTSKCAFFFPAYMNRLGCYDSNGNSDVIKALKEICSRRMVVKYNTSDPNTLLQVKAEMPITPQEAVLRREGSIFPVADIKDYMAEIMTNFNAFVGSHSLGHLKLDSNNVVSWSNEELHPPLRDYPIKSEIDRHGCVEIYEHPRRTPDGKVVPNRYIAGIDPIDTDEGEYTNSLGVIFIFDSWTDRIVAEYSGRPPFVNDFYETCLRLLMYYNATANYENNIKGLFPYFDNRRALHYLCDTPQILRDLDFAKGNLFGNRSKGFTSNQQIKAIGRRWQVDWLLSPAYVPPEEEEYDEDGNKIEKPKLLNLYKVRSIGYLREMLAWHPDGNFDRISAMTAVMIYRADRMKYEQYKYTGKVKDVFDDPWFNRVFGKKEKIIFDALRYMAQ